MNKSSQTEANKLTKRLIFKYGYVVCKVIHNYPKLLFLAPRSSNTSALQRQLIYLSRRLHSGSSAINNVSLTGPKKYLKFDLLFIKLANACQRIFDCVPKHFPL